MHSNFSGCITDLTCIALSIVFHGICKEAII
jgi:hypothetical protein